MHVVHYVCRYTIDLSFTYQLNDSKVDGSKLVICSPLTILIILLLTRHAKRCLIITFEVLKFKIGIRSE
jgi:hypothetical protein